MKMILYSADQLYSFSQNYRLRGETFRTSANTIRIFAKCFSTKINALFIYYNILICQVISYNGGIEQLAAIFR